MHKSTISQPERNLRYRFASGTLIFGRRTRRANHPWLKIEPSYRPVRSALRTDRNTRDENSSDAVSFARAIAMSPTVGSSPAR